MPTIKVAKDLLAKELGKAYSTDELRELCFDFGIELEDEVTESELLARETNTTAADTGSSPVLYLIDIPANRYDLLCPEGLCRALRVYLGLAAPPKYRVVPREGAAERIVVEAGTAAVRPFIVGALLRNITFTPAVYDHFIELQEKLHQNICRRRTLAAIGTHDYDTVQGPFRYAARKPADIRFVPLQQSVEMDGAQLMQFYESDRHLGKFLPIIRDAPEYPVVLDAAGRVCSLPPIINSDRSKITLQTRNVFVEVTATNLNKAQIVLNTMVTMFSQYCAEPFAVEPVDVVAADGTVARYPQLDDRSFDVSTEYLRATIGVPLTDAAIVANLGKMCLGGTLTGDGRVAVRVPPTRADILHACDIMEDVAIAHNFNAIPKRMPACSTIGAPLPVNALSDAVRLDLAFAGYTEVMPLILCSSDENYAHLRRKPDGLAVVLANPKTVEYQVVRTSLLPGILKTLRENRRFTLPIQLFEVADVVMQDSASETLARNERRVCALYCGTTSGFEVIHGLVGRLMAALNVSRGSLAGQYEIAASSDPAFFPLRGADLMFSGARIGFFGVVHPDVLAKFEIPYPCSVVEFNLEPFV